MADTDQGWTLASLFAKARATLENAAIPDATLEARLLLEHFTGTSRAEAIAEPDRSLLRSDAQAVLSSVGRRLSGEPVYRILGFREFYGLKLMLSPETLEPRPDTETLVDLALPVARAAATALGTCRILDLGTGTGAVALALLREVPDAQAVGTDISGGALATARRNADLNGVGSRFTVAQANWYAGLAGRFHIIVSNPPYIRSGDVPDLDREVREHDPLAALDGGHDGLGAYRSIAETGRDHLCESGHVAVEIGYDQRDAVTEIFRAAGFDLVGVGRDLGRHDRALLFR